MDAKVLGVSFLCEAGAEGLGLETDAELTQARCRECGQVKACLATVKPRDPGDPRALLALPMRCSAETHNSVA